MIADQNKSQHLNTINSKRSDPPKLEIASTLTELYKSANLLIILIFC